MQVAFSIETVAGAFIEEIEEVLGVRPSLFPACDSPTAALFRDATGLEEASEIVSKVRISIPGVATVIFGDGDYAVWDVDREEYVLRGYLSDREVVESIIDALRSIMA